jgi:hypothetical protein
MLSTAGNRMARALGAAAGVAAAMALLVAARPSATVPGLPASVRLTLAPSGTLAASPSPPESVLWAPRLEPGANHVASSFRLRNQSGMALRVGFRARPDSRALDGIVRVRIDGPGGALANTTLQGLRRPSAGTVRIRSGQTRRLDLAVWIPGSVTGDYQGRVVRVALTPTTAPAGGGP